MVNTRGSHGMSCKRSAGKTLRHNYPNDIIYHALLKTRLLSIKEPTGLLRTDGISGLIALPTYLGKLANWLCGTQRPLSKVFGGTSHAVADILTDSYLASTSMTVAAAAELAATRKEAKYVELSTKHHFVPLAFKSLGPIGSKATKFLKNSIVA